MFGKRLRLLREEKGITQKDLAKFLGITDRSVGYYETEERKPAPDILKRIAEYFNVTTDYLLGVTDIRNPYIENQDKNKEITTKAYHNLDVEGLPEEAIRQVEEYIEFIKQKYNPDGTLKKKDSK